MNWSGMRPSLEEQAGLDVNKTDEKVMAQAIAAYVRTILSGDSPDDRFQAGDRSALSESAQRGLSLFEGKAMCSRCQAGFNFTGENYRNIGVGMAAQ